MPDYLQLWVIPGCSPRCLHPATRSSREWHRDQISQWAFWPGDTGANGHWPIRIAILLPTGWCNLAPEARNTSLAREFPARRSPGSSLLAVLFDQEHGLHQVLATQPPPLIATDKAERFPRSSSRSVSASVAPSHCRPSHSRRSSSALGTQHDLSGLRGSQENEG